MQTLRFLSLLLLFPLLLASCAESEAGAEGADDADVVVAEDPDAEETAGPVNVRLMTVQPEAFDDIIEVVGTVRASEDITVASEEGGKVVKWYVRKGSYVKRGQRLARMDGDVLHAQLEAAEAQAKIARLDAEKKKEVFDDAGAIPEVTVTTSAYSLEVAEAQVKLLKTRIAKKTVTAPVSGRIDARIADVGEMVPPGGPVARLLQTGVVEIEAGVPERYAGNLRVGTPVEMVFDGLGGRRVNGKIGYIGSGMDRTDRTLPVEIDVSNPGGSLKPGMVAEIEILRNRLRNVVVLPRTALIRVEDGYQVYVATAVGDGHIAEARPVTIGATDRGLVVVTDGLAVGERIIAVGQNKVNPGAPISFDD